MSNRHALILVGLLALYVLAYRPAAGRVATLTRVVPREAEQLRQLRDLAGAYRTKALLLERIRSGLDRRKLSDHLKKVLREIDVGSDRMRLRVDEKRIDEGFTEVTADINLSRVTIGEVARLLEGVESERGLLQRNLKIVAATRTGLIDASLTITSIVADAR